MSKNLSFFKIFLFWFTAFYFLSSLLNFFPFSLTHTRFLLFILSNFISVQSLFVFFLTLGVGIVFFLLTVYFKGMRVLVITVGPILSLLMAFGIFEGMRTCEDLGCLGPGFGLLVAPFYWLILSALIPIAWVLNKSSADEVLLNSFPAQFKKTLKPAIISLLFFTAVFLFAKSFMIVESISQAKKDTALQQQFQQIKQQMIYLQPSYFPVGWTLDLPAQQAIEHYLAVFNLSDPHTYPLGIGTLYGHYADNAVCMKIIQTPLSNEQTRESIAQLKNDILQQGRLNSLFVQDKMEDVAIKGSPALYLENSHDPGVGYGTLLGAYDYTERKVAELMYQDLDSQIEIFLPSYSNSACPIKSLKEELIKIGESLAPAK